MLVLIATLQSVVVRRRRIGSWVSCCPVPVPTVRWRRRGRVRTIRHVQAGRSLGASDDVGLVVSEVAAEAAVDVLAVIVRDGHAEVIEPAVDAVMHHRFDAGRRNVAKQFSEVVAHMYFTGHGTVIVVLKNVVLIFSALIAATIRSVT